MQNVNVRTLTPGKFFSKPVYLDERFVLLSPETPLPQELRDRLLTWGFDTVRTDGVATDAPTSTGPASGEAPVVGTLDQDLREATALQAAADFYLKLVNFTEGVFSDYVSSGAISHREVSDHVRSILDEIKQHRRYLLRLTDLPKTAKNYIVNHSAKTTILCMAVGLSMKYPPHKLMELGSAALMHELGMVRLPQQVYMSEGELNPQEKKAIMAHTILGFKVLKANSFPLNVCVAVLECRERLDGSGYPRGLTGDKISQPARIVAACSAYAALVSERPYREARNPHFALLEVMKGRNVSYDETVIRHLVFNLSLYPLGTRVQLANGSRGIVVDTDEQNPRAPRVRVVLAPTGERYVDQPVVETKDGEYVVTAVLDAAEASAIPSV